MQARALVAQVSEHVGWRGPPSTSAACAGQHGYLVDVGVDGVADAEDAEGHADGGHYL